VAAHAAAAPVAPVTADAAAAPVTTVAHGDATMPSTHTSAAEVRHFCATGKRHHQHNAVHQSPPTTRVETTRSAPDNFPTWSWDPGERVRPRKREARGIVTLPSWVPGTQGAKTPPRRTPAIGWSGLEFRLEPVFGGGAAQA